MSQYDRLQPSQKEVADTAAKVVYMIARLNFDSIQELKEQTDYYCRFLQNVYLKQHTTAVIKLHRNEINLDIYKPNMDDAKIAEIMRWVATNPPEQLSPDEYYMKFSYFNSPSMEKHEFIRMAINYGYFNNTV